MIVNVAIYVRYRRSKEATRKADHDAFVVEQNIFLMKYAITA